MVDPGPRGDGGEVGVGAVCLASVDDDGLAGDGGVGARPEPGLVLQVDDVSVTLMDGTHPRTVVFTSPIAVDVDEQSVGLPVPQRIIGALNMYATTTEPIDEATIELATTFASYAAVAVANAALYSATADLAEQMQAAMRSRAVIDQAKGILMAHRRCSATEAFDVLTQLSQNQNRKLRDVAQAIVNSIQTP